MGDDAPRRHKTDEELSVDEHLQRIQAEGRGETWRRPETAEYVEARREALAAAGLEPDDDPAEKAPEDMTAEDHVRAMRSGR
jgi:hypothetical protein